MARTSPEYRAGLARVRANDAANTARMEKIAKAGGKTLNELRAMPMRDKDAFIAHFANYVRDDD